MPIFGWDASSYDGRITTTIARKAKAEGIRFATHRLLRQGNLLDSYAAGNLAALRDAGVEFLGTYGVVSSGEGVSDADRLLAMATQRVPWWRDFPGWFWQVDLERWATDSVPASDGIACARRLRDRTGRLVMLYASHGQYGDQLKGWDGPLWNADYTGRAAAGFAAMYPGDDWAPLHGGMWRGGWTPYSGKAPTMLQYTSKATIAGLTTCDANAFRGTLAQLRALVYPKGDDMPTADEIAEAVWAYLMKQVLDDRMQPASAYLRYNNKQIYANGTSLAALRADVAAALGRDPVDEDQIVQGVLSGLGGKDPQTIAAALLAVMSPEQALAVGQLLIQG